MHREPLPDPAEARRSFEEARRRIAPHVRRTPVVESAWLGSLTGGRVLLKLESLQITGSFKLRGTANVAVRLAESAKGRDDRRVFVTASAGNHGRALAHMARRLGLSVVVFTPADAPAVKLAAIRQSGAELRAVGADYDQAEREAKAWAAERDLPFISPYNHPDVIAGAATLGLEICSEVPEATDILVPVGGGGLLSGVGLAARAASPGIRIVGTEAAVSPAFSAAFAAGRIVPVRVGRSLADGLTGNLDPDTVTFELARAVVDEIVDVPEDRIREAVRRLVQEEHLVAEGAGAVGVAALVAGQVQARDRTVVVIVSGANIDPARLAGVISG